MKIIVLVVSHEVILVCMYTFFLFLWIVLSFSLVLIYAIMPFKLKNKKDVFTKFSVNFQSILKYKIMCMHIQANYNAHNAQLFESSVTQSQGVSQVSSFLLPVATQSSFTIFCSNLFTVSVVYTGFISIQTSL